MYGFERALRNSKVQAHADALTEAYTEGFKDGRAQGRQETYEEIEEYDDDKYTEGYDNGYESRDDEMLTNVREAWRKATLSIDSAFEHGSIEVRDVPTLKYVTSAPAPSTPEELAQAFLRILSAACADGGAL